MNKDEQEVIRTALYKIMHQCIKMGMEPQEVLNEMHRASKNLVYTDVVYDPVIRLRQSTILRVRA